MGDGSEVQSEYCSYRRPKFSFQYPQQVYNCLKVQFLNTWHPLLDSTGTCTNISTYPEPYVQILKIK